MAAFNWTGFYLAIEHERARRRVDRKTVAKEAGITASSLSRFAQGRGLSLEGVVKLAKWAGVKIDDFMNGEGDG